MIRDGGFATKLLGIVVALLVGVEKGKEHGGDAVFGRVASKLDNGEERRGLGDAGGGSDRIAEDEGGGRSRR